MRREVPDEVGGPSQFGGLSYIPGAALKAWLHCPPVPVLDACALKGRYMGQLLQASIVDGNCGLLPLAMAVG